MQDVSVIVDAKLGNTLVERSEEEFPKFKFQVDHVPNWVPGNMKENQPAVTLTWDSHRDRRANSLSTETATVYERLGIDRRHRMKTCTVVTPNTDTATNKVTLRIEFETLGTAQIAVGKIQANPPDFQSFTCNLPNTHQYSIRIPLAQYEAQKKQWLDLTDGRNKEDAYLDWKIVGNIVSIQIQGENKASIGALKVRIEKLSRGDVLDAPYWHPSFASPQESTSFVQEVTKTNRVYLCCEPETRGLRVYGEPGGTTQARQMIQEEVNRRKQVLTRTPLPNLSSADFFVKEGLGKLQELVGEDNVVLTKTSTWAAIKMRGGEEAKHHLQRLIRDSLLEDSAKDSAAGTCPICFNEVAYPEVLECGHVYCPGCLSDYLTSAADNKTFPIVCMGNEGACRIPIALPLLRSFLPYSTFKQLIEAAVTSYVERNPAEIRYCKTPDCRQTYRPDPERTGVRLVCPSCFVTGCSSCGVDHENMTCREYHIQHDQEEQERLNNELAANSGFKKCPRCAVWIEKNGGCNRVSCRCGATMCWICLGDFSTAEIYEHIRVVHANNLYN